MVITKKDMEETSKETIEEKIINHIIYLNNRVNTMKGILENLT